MLHTQPDNIEMMSCFNTACEGGRSARYASTGELCSEGFTGTLCTDCSEGNGVVSGFGCETCLDPYINALRLGGVLLAVFLVMILFIVQTIKSAEVGKSELSTIGKILFSFLQFVMFFFVSLYVFFAFRCFFLKLCYV